MIRHAAGIFILIAVLALAGCMAASQTGNFSVDAQMIDTVKIPDDTAAPGMLAPTGQLSATPTYTPHFTATPAIAAEPTDAPTPTPTAEPTAEPTPARQLNRCGGNAETDKIARAYQNAYTYAEVRSYGFGEKGSVSKRWLC